MVSKSGNLTLAIIAVTAVLSAAGWLGFTGWLAGESQIVLEQAAEQGSDPFVPSPAAAAEAPDSAPPGPPVSVPAASDAPAAAPPAGVTSGTGCDPERLIAFIASDPARAAAWTQALNADPALWWSGGGRVEVDQIGAYMRELTPRTLDRDLRVTNHGFKDGRLRAFQAVLQQGSGVLVDGQGVPRVRCQCGNPLLPMQPVTTTTPTYLGTPWTDFEPVPEHRPVSPHILTPPGPAPLDEARRAAAVGPDSPPAVDPPAAADPPPAAADPPALLSTAESPPPTDPDATVTAGPAPIDPLVGAPPATTVAAAPADDPAADDSTADDSTGTGSTGDDPRDPREEDPVAKLIQEQPPPRVVEQPLPSPMEPGPPPPDETAPPPKEPFTPPAANETQPPPGQPDTPPAITNKEAPGADPSSSDNLSEFADPSSGT